MNNAANTRHRRRELMGRTALLFGWGNGPSPRYNAVRGGVKATRLVGAAAVLALLSLASVFSPARAAAPDSTTAPNGDRAPFVNRIIFTGNTSIKSDNLRNRMRTRQPSTLSIFRKPRLDLTQLERDVVQLEAYYHSVGYPDATVRRDRIDYLENGRFADVYIAVVEGQPNQVRTVAFKGKLVLPEKSLRDGLLLTPGAPYNAALLETDIYTIRGKYWDKGYLAVLIADSVRIDKHRVDITFNIDPGAQLHIGKITIDGNEQVRTGVVEAEIEVKEGEVCRYDKVVETERNLFETGLFSVVDMLPEHVDTTANTVDIRIRVRERKESWVEAGFGVGNVLGSRVFAEWGTRNLAGTGRTVRLKTQYAFDLFAGDEIDPNKLHITNTYYRYDAIYQQRRIFGLKLPTALNGYLEEDGTVPDLEVRTLGAAIGVSHEFGRIRDFGRESRLTGSFAIEEITRRPAGEPEEKSNSHILSSSVSRDTRDFILNPSMGEYRVLSGQVAGGILGGENDFYGMDAAYQRYHGVAVHSVFAWRIRAGYAEPYGRSTEVPVENRYFLGGSNSVRGYEESGLGPRDADGNIEGGAFLLLANVEIRYPLPYVSRWHFSGAVFIDSGNVWASASDLRGSGFRLTSSVDETTVDDYRYGVGLGIRYNTPVGPIRVDFGYPLNPDHYTNKNGTFYLSLGQIF